MPALGARPFFTGAIQRPLVCRSPIATGLQRRQRLQVTAALQDPWATLGVSRDASEKEIKKAHRKLVKQHHPDVKSNDPMANARFIRIQEAYELIMGKRSGKDLEGVPGSRSSWSFHDWYWSFSTKRRAKARGFAGAAGGAEPAPDREQWRAQMAGLRQKAAAKRGRRRPAHAAADGQARSGGAGAQGPAGGAAGPERKGSDSEQQPPKAPSGMTGAAAATAAQAEPAEPPLHRAEAAGQEAAQQRTANSAASGASQPSGNEGASHASAAGHEHGDPLHGAMPRASHHVRLQQLLEHAVGLVHSVRRSAADTAAAHVELREHATAAALRHLGGRLAGWEHLAAALGGQHAAAEQHAGHGEAGNAVPADPHLHHHFQASRQRRQHRLHAPTEAQQVQHDFQQGLFRRAAHARKFADRQEVEGRLSGQLAGMRRRATVKQEISSNC